MSASISQQAEKTIRLYLITDRTNGKVYVGQTCWPVEKRWKGHQYSAEEGLDTYFCRAIRNRNPATDFEVKQIDSTPSEQEANELEKLYIGIFNSWRPQYGYNTTMGGIGCRPTPETIQKMRDNAPWKGKKRSKEYCENMSRILKGRPKSPEHRQKISEATKGQAKPEAEQERLRNLRLGTTLSEEHKRKIARPGASNHFFGKTHSEETRLKISVANKGKTTGVKRGPTSEAIRQKISQALMGRFIGRDNPNYGKKHSPETREKMKAYWAKRREEKSLIDKP